MLWSLGALGDSSSSVIALLDEAANDSDDPRQAFAAAIALYRISGKPHVGALHLYRQLAAATWFAEAFLAGVPWDFSAEVHVLMESLGAEFEPDPLGATQTLLACLTYTAANDEPFPLTEIVHDLLELNFPGGKWRECKQLTNCQAEILRRLVETDAAWSDTKRLWFLIADRTRSILELEPSEIDDVRIEMRSILGRRGN